MAPDRETYIDLTPKKYSSRVIHNLRGAAIFALILTAAMYLSNPSTLSLIIGLLVFLFYLFEEIRWCRIYITSVSVSPGNKVKFAYLDKDVQHEYSTNLVDLDIKKAFIWYKVKPKPVPFLVIRNRTDDFVIKQYDVSDWDEEKFNLLINRFGKLKE